ncbi:glycoside hydrolase family 16 protein, partial [Methylobacterium sp. J-076]|uniref:glycoside hydrolase family 16 protein n=1 Tax=Methylobacterium sp. J-076 TaxID=2836655 RepID=UPI001FBA3408
MLDLTGYKLTFDDEFNARSISQTGAGTTWADIRSDWRYDANSDIGFGHSSFVDPASGYDPFKVQGGALSITAVPDKTPSGYPGSWESGLITTKGNFSQTYGYFEMRADLADAKGGWDAFWLLPDKPAANPSNLPGWQELDVVEHYGANNKGVYSTIHTTDQTPNIPWQQNRQVYSETAQAGGYHTYGMDWQKDKISFYVDGKFVGSQATPSDMHGPMYLLADLATQSDADAAGVPITTKIDYIRAYSNNPNAVAVTQGAVSAPDGQDPGLYGATAAGSATPAKTTATATATAATTTTVTTAAVAAAATPFTTSIGTGSDTLVLKLSEDAYKGDAQYTISVDGKQVGGTLTAHASHAAGQSDTIT